MIGTPPSTIERCKAVEALFIGSLNLRGGYRGSKDELLGLAEDYCVDVLALSDIRRSVRRTVERL